MRKIYVLLITLLVINIANGQKVNLDSGLVALYQFDGDGYDASGNGNNAVLNGVTSATDRFNNPGKAYTFNGSSSYVPYNSSLYPQNWTMACWVKLNAMGGVIFGNVNDCRDFAIGSSGDGRFLAWHAGNGCRDAAYSTTYAALNKWYFVTGTYYNGNLKIYVNGAFQAQTSSPLTGSSSRELRIANSSCCGEYLNASLDE